MQRFFIDTEFMEDGRIIELLSIGITGSVGEGGDTVNRGYYAISKNANWGKANSWVKKHVIPILHRDIQRRPELMIDRTQIRDEIVRWITPIVEVEPIEFWGYFSDYDWVAFCQLFGRMIDLPKGFPMYCNDLKQYAHMIGVGSEEIHGNVYKVGLTEHSAFDDSVWNSRLYDYLQLKELDWHRKLNA